MSFHGGKSRVSTFDGKQENYEEFEMQWNEFAQVEGFVDGHQNMQTGHKDVILDEAQGEGKKQARAKKENPKAVAYYTLAFKSARLRGMISKAKTDEWPGREAWKIRESLIKKYIPDILLRQLRHTAGSMMRA
jgi:hypothetical protein